MDDMAVPFVVSEVVLLALLLVGVAIFRCR
jgi:hypothetical protein